MKNNLSEIQDSDFRILFESAPGLYLVLTKNLTIVAVSNAYLSATMTMRENIMGRGLFEIFPDNPDDPDATGTRNLKASLDRVIKNKIPDTMPVQKYDIRKPQAEGGEFEERHWSPVNTPVFDESGEIKYIIHRVEDITEFVKLQRRGGEMEYEVYLRSKEVSDANKKLLEANKELAELNRKMKEHSLQRLRAVEDNAVDGLITIDDRGVIESFNPACEKIFGYKKEEVIGQNIKMLMPEPYHSQHDGYLDNYHRTGVAKIIGIGREVSGKRKDGSVFPMDLSVGAFYLDDGKHYSGIVRDITERKESEELKNQLRQAQKIEAIGQLTGGIAHDFNNLLAVILGNLDMLSERVKPKDPLHEFIKPSIEAAERGAELTQSLLAFSRKQSLQPKVLSINDIIMNFSTLVSRTLGERVELMYSLAPYIWPVNVDSGQLENALLNLSVNSRDAMPKGGKLIYETKNVHLDGEYSSHNPEVIPGDYVMIAVTDTGEGMDSETIEKAFEPFFTTKDIGKGSGLGLSMVHGFVKQSNGHVKIYSEIGHGTSIKIYLPRVEGEIKPIEKKQEDVDVLVRKNTQVILVVEDNIEVLRLTSAMVTSLGYNVIEAMSGEMAIGILKIHDDIDLLLTDVILSGQMNGAELADEALRMRPNLKVLFNSGYAESAIFKAGFLAEGANILSKPFRKPQLAGKLKELLKK